jgi:hypothetical protein
LFQKYLTQNKPFQFLKSLTERKTLRSFLHSPAQNLTCCAYLMMLQLFTYNFCPFIFISSTLCICYSLSDYAFHFLSLFFLLLFAVLGIETRKEPYHSGHAPILFMFVLFCSSLLRQSC